MRTGGATEHACARQRRRRRNNSARLAGALWSRRHRRRRHRRPDAAVGCDCATRRRLRFAVLRYVRRRRSLRVCMRTLSAADEAFGASGSLLNAVAQASKAPDDAAKQVCIESRDERATLTTRLSFSLSLPLLSPTALSAPGESGRRRAHGGARRVLARHGVQGERPARSRRERQAGAARSGQGRRRGDQGSDRCVERGRGR